MAYLEGLSIVFAIIGFFVPLLFMFMAFGNPAKITRNSTWIQKIDKRICESRLRLAGLCFVLWIVMTISGSRTSLVIEEYRIQTEPGYAESVAAQEKQRELERQQREVEKAEQKEAEARAEKARNFSASIGDNVTLSYLDSSTISWLAVNDEAWDMMTEALAAKDAIGITQLEVSGLVHRIESGTKALVLDVGFTSYKVRVLDGPHFGAAGWVYREFVQP